MLQQTTIRIPELRKLNVQAIGRSFSLFFLRPMAFVVECLFFTAGIGFLLDFLLRFFPAPAIESFWPMVLFRQFTDPVLAPWKLAMVDSDVISPDAYQALPLALSLFAWIARPVVSRRLKEARSRLELAPIESLFLRQPASEKLDKSSGEELFLGDDFSSARLVEADPSEDSPSPIRTSTNQILRTIGRYELVQELGRGPAGAVYKALDLRLGRIVVLKIMIPSGHSAEEIHSQTEKLYHEARTAAKMMHPGIVTIFDAAEDSLGNPYIVMEYVEGETLAQALDLRYSEEPLSLAERMEIAIQVSRTLDYAHRRGIVHRDIKPSNILITSEGNTKIADFGIAMHLNGEAAEESKIPGTPAFVAPEILNGSTANAASDLFSLGVLMYWMFTGEIPFSGRTVTEIVHQVAHSNPRPARRLNWALPQELDRILDRCLAKKPADRYPSTGELAADLMALRDGRLENARLSA
ncbi:MAG: serine/threonine protein kinase [Acidobacteria bacterium]|nr:serine/threonine protein kinase [Acidobacteriota bacterium]